MTPRRFGMREALERVETARRPVRARARGRPGARACFAALSARSEPRQWWSASGPNGPAAAIASVAGWARGRGSGGRTGVGGGSTRAEHDAAGFAVHDASRVGAAVALGSPFFRTLELDVEWAHPDAPATHPLDDGSAVVLERGLDETASGLMVGGGVPPARRAAGRGVGRARARAARVVPPPPPRRGLRGRSGRRGLRGPATAARAGASATRARWRSRSRNRPGSGLVRGSRAHSMLPLERRPSAGVGLALAVLGHASRLAATLGGAAVARRGARLAGAARARRLDRHRRGGGRAAGRARARGRLAAGTREARAWPAAGRATNSGCALRHGPGVVQGRLGARRADPVARRGVPPRSDGAPRRHARTRSPRSERAPEQAGSPTRPFVSGRSADARRPRRAPAAAKARRRGRTATCRTAPTCDVTDADRGAGRALRARLPRADRCARSAPRPERRSRRRNRNPVGGDINGGRDDLGQVFRRPRRGSSRSSDAARGRLPCVRASTPLRAAESTACAGITRPGRALRNRNEPQARRVPAGHVRGLSPRPWPLERLWRSCCSLGAV